MEEIYRDEQIMTFFTTEDPFHYEHDQVINQVVSNPRIIPPFKYAAKFSGMMTFCPENWGNFFQTTSVLLAKMSYHFMFKSLGYVPFREVLLKKTTMNVESNSEFFDDRMINNMVIPHFLFDFFEYRKTYLLESEQQIEKVKTLLLEGCLNLKWETLIEGSTLPKPVPESLDGFVFPSYTLAIKLPYSSPAIITSALFMAIEGPKVLKVAENCLATVQKIVQMTIKNKSVAFDYSSLILLFGVYELAVRNQSTDQWHFAKIQRQLNETLNNRNLKEAVEMALQSSLNRQIYNTDHRVLQNFTPNIEKWVANSTGEEQVPTELEDSLAESTSDPLNETELPVYSVREEKLKDIDEAIEAEELISWEGSRGRMPKKIIKSIPTVFPVSMALEKNELDYLEKKAKFIQNLLFEEHKFDVPNFLVNFTQSREFCQIFQPSAAKRLLESQLKDQRLTYGMSHWEFPVLFDAVVYMGRRTVFVDVEDEYKRYYNVPLSYPEERLKREVCRARGWDYVVLTGDDLKETKDGLVETLLSKILANKELK